MASKLDNEVPDYTWKIILVGNKRVGKTSITNRYIKDSFEEEYKSSQVIEYQKKNMTIEGTEKWAQMHIWDTLGQEKFKHLAPIFFRKSVGAFLVYDVTNRDSFLALDGWKEQLNNSTESKIVVMLVGNKVDMGDKKVITTDMGQDYARQTGWGFAEVSAKTNVGIDAAFKSLITNIYAEVNAKHVISNPNAQGDKNVQLGKDKPKTTGQEKKKCC